jgi:hypothetical protein
MTRMCRCRSGASLWGVWPIQGRAGDGCPLDRPRPGPAASIGPPHLLRWRGEGHIGSRGRIAENRSSPAAPRHEGTRRRHPPSPCSRRDERAPKPYHIENGTVPRVCPVRACDLGITGREGVRATSAIPRSASKDRERRGQTRTCREHAPDTRYLRMLLHGGSWPSALRPPPSGRTPVMRAPDRGVPARTVATTVGGPAAGLVR